jgi:aspartyl/glutamyl-tRNA(Asn/Gln) amidotransferase C subunit
MAMEKTETPLETVERLSTLARIAVPEDRKEALASEFQSVIAYIAQLNELDISVSDTPALPKLHNVTRPDGNAYEAGSWTEEIVNAFPAKAGNALSVKKIISHD